MIKKVILSIMILLSISLCALTPNFRITAFGAQASTDKKPLVWGSVHDKLKTFYDYETGEINWHGDYDIEIQYGKSHLTNCKKIKVPEIMKYGVLIGVRDRKIQLERPKRPIDEYCTIITLTNGSRVYKFFLYDNGMIYTEQNGKLYYLGSRKFTVVNARREFVSAALFYNNNITAEQGGVPKLPRFKPVDDPLAVTPKEQRQVMATKEEAEKYKRTYSPDEYDVAVVFMDDGTCPPALRITDEKYKKLILNSLSDAWTYMPKTELYMGFGDYIRVYNDKECYNFYYMGNYIVNYQIGDKYAYFEMPYSLLSFMYDGSAKRISEILSQ